MAVVAKCSVANGGAPKEVLCPYLVTVHFFQIAGSCKLLKRQLKKIEVNHASARPTAIITGERTHSGACNVAHFAVPSAVRADPG